MGKNKKLVDIWKQVPPDYYDRGMKKNPFQYIWHTQKMRVFKKISQGKKFSRILDIGCASGLMTNKIASCFPESKIIGIDAYQNAINFAKIKYPYIDFLVADAHKLPFKKNYFDLIICYETIEHVVNPKEVFREISRVLKTHGTVIIAMDSGNFLFRMIWCIWERTTGKVWQGAHFHPFHHLELEEKIKEANFQITKKHFSHLGMEVSFVLKK